MITPNIHSYPEDFEPPDIDPDDYRPKFRPQPQPPCSNRGDETSRILTNEAFLLSCASDYLTITVPYSTAQCLMEWTKLDQDMGPQRTFESVQARAALGGTVFRKFNPKPSATPTKAWGMEYESWECSGGTSGPMMDLCLDKPSRPSRLDGCFDFIVPRSVTPVSIKDQIKPFITDKNFTIREQSSEKNGHKVTTVYIGSEQSERDVVIYDKLEESAQHQFTFADLDPGMTIIRFEVRLKGKQARAVWKQVQAKGKDHFKVLANSHIHDMTGLDLIGDLTDLPELEKPKEADSALQLSLWVKNNGPHLATFLGAGIDQDEIIEMCFDSLNDTSRTKAWRLRNIGNEIAEANPENVLSAAKKYLYGRAHKTDNQEDQKRRDAEQSGEDSDPQRCLSP